MEEDSGGMILHYLSGIYFEVTHRLKLEKAIHLPAEIRKMDGFFLVNPLAIFFNILNLDYEIEFSYASPEMFPSRNRIAFAYFGCNSHLKIKMEKLKY